jgi:hypothetical protein
MQFITFASYLNESPFGHPASLSSFIAWDVDVSDSFRFEKQWLVRLRNYIRNGTFQTLSEN